MRFLGALLLVLVSYIPATAQRVEPSIGVGQIGLDAYHPAFTGSVRIYVIQGFSIDPELLYVRGTNDIGTKTRALQFGPSVAYTFLREGRVSPYAIGGAHFGKVRREFSCSIRCIAPSTSFTWNTGSAGGGVRFRLGESFFVSPEFRLVVDEEAPYLRFTVNVGAILSQ